MIKYLGSKRVLLPHILAAVEGLVPPGALVADLFSGTARVGHALKGAGYRVWANDHNSYAHMLAMSHVQADADRWAEKATAILADLARLPPRPGWFTHTFCEKARYFHPDNGGRIEAIREAIAAMGAEPELEAVLLAALVLAADRVDSTAGLQMAYMKKWAVRALKPLELRLPKLLPRPAGGPCIASQAEAEVVAPQLGEAAVAYLDPPYNQHSYLRNYHVWETLVLWDAPETYGIAEKRVDCRTRLSAFNSRPGFLPAFTRLIDALPCRALVVSFSNEGFVDRETLAALLAARGRVTVQEIAYNRYVGARIGIHNPQGEKVGQPGHLTNTEYLFVLQRD